MGRSRRRSSWPPTGDAIDSILPPLGVHNTEEHDMAPDPAPRPRLLTFSSGGWVLLVAGLLMVAEVVWALGGGVSAHRAAPGR